MRSTPWILGFVALALLAWSPQHVAADPWKDESGHGAGGYKYEYDDGNCKYEYKADGHGYKEERKCRGGAYYTGGPPPWAPAHGYRRQHGGRYHAARAAYAPPFDLDVGRCNRAAVGAVLGGATGGLLGSTIGSGDERTAAIIGGSVIGVLVGGSIGHYMDQVDQTCVGQTLEHARDGQTIVWNTGPSGARHQITPVATYQGGGGQYCREYQAVSVIAGQEQQTYGTACRQPDGSWKLAN